MVDQAAEEIARYHEQTKHHINRYARSPGYMDWKNQPNPFRFYEGTVTVPLPFAAQGPPLEHMALYRRQTESGEPFSLSTVAGFLELSLGLSAWKVYGNSRWSLRINHLNLDTPSLVQRMKNSLNQQQANDLASRLLACGEESLQETDHEMADKCLHYSLAIKDTPEVRTALSQLESWRAAQRQSDIKKTHIIQVKKEKRLARKHRDRTQEVLEKTEQALDNNDLPAACRIFRELPKGGSESGKVVALRTRLNNAIRSRVRAMTSEGDRQYRADNVVRAIHSWDGALELDPDNPELTERLERARKVLARLEELKNKQRATAKQSRDGS